MCDFHINVTDEGYLLWDLVAVEISFFGHDRLKNSSPRIRGVASVWESHLMMVNVTKCMGQKVKLRS